MGESFVTKPNQGRTRQYAVLSKQRADDILRDVETRHWLSMPVTVELKRNSPSCVAHAPYTLGVKKTKSKMSSGGRHPEQGSSTNMCKNPISDALAFESRGYESKANPWRFRVRGNILVYENDKKCRAITVLQFVERFDRDKDERYLSAEWVITFDSENSHIYTRALEFLGLDPGKESSLSAIAAERRCISTYKSAADRERCRKAAKRVKNNNRPGKRERDAARTATNDAGEPRQTHKLY
jgi:hypothetical protein